MVWLQECLGSHSAIACETHSYPCCSCSYRCQDRWVLRRQQTLSWPGSAAPHPQLPARCWPHEPMCFESLESREPADPWMRPSSLPWSQNPQTRRQHRDQQGYAHCAAARGRPTKTSLSEARRPRGCGTQTQTGGDGNPRPQRRKCPIALRIMRRSGPLNNQAAPGWRHRIRSHVNPANTESELEQQHIRFWGYVLVFVSCAAFLISM
jgi:hypothetical protein